MATDRSEIDTPETRRLIDAARDEDLGPGDLTSVLLRAPDRVVEARVVARKTGVICGLALGPAIGASFQSALRWPLAFEPRATDGDVVAIGAVVAALRGAQAAVLAAERTLLNFIGRLSGVATLTRRYVDAAHAGHPAARVYDTRKTTPGWRRLEKYAVRCGGGHNHRLGLFDAVLIKDNHLAGVATADLSRHVRELVARIAGHPAFVEVEVDRLEQFRALCPDVAADIILLDNFSLSDLREAVQFRDACGRRGAVALEASGGITLDTIGEVAATGVDRIAVGALTHAATALDVALDL